ncbi:MAG: hypothetical protein A2138_26885 [Deltaproteobacteria bacterium RBG_16_71_12]|nr:MAG: hypothetical protein A2138_26885 [Deltaproteobacteria bacterium RBG_16_71_12]
MTDARPAASVEYIEGKGCIRRVQCPLKYHPTTSNFIGLSENGWVFKCPGNPPHLILARPPEGEQ